MKHARGQVTRTQKLSQMMHKGEEILDGCKSGWSRATHEGQTAAPQCSKHGCQDDRPYNDLVLASHPRSSSRCLKGAGVARAGGGKQSRHCPGHLPAGPTKAAAPCQGQMMSWCLGDVETSPVPYLVERHLGHTHSTFVSV